MSLLPDVDFSGIPMVSDGVYEVEVIDFLKREYEVNSVDHDGAIGHELVAWYKIISGTYKGFEVASHPQPANPWNSPKRTWYLGRFLLAHGVERARFNTFEPDEVIGRTMKIEVRDGEVYPFAS